MNKAQRTLSQNGSKIMGESSMAGIYVPPEQLSK